MNNIAKQIGAILTNVIDNDTAVEFDLCCIGHATSFGMRIRAMGYEFQRTDIHFVVTKGPKPEYQIKRFRTLKDGLIEIVFEEDPSHHVDVDIDNLRDKMDSLEYRVAKAYFSSDDQVPVTTCAEWRDGNTLLIRWNNG